MASFDKLPSGKWHDVIGEPTFADAILDRLVDNSYRLKLDRPLMRKTRAGKGEKTASEHAGSDHSNGLT